MSRLALIFALIAGGALLLSIFIVSGSYTGSSGTLTSAQPEQATTQTNEGGGIVRHAFVDDLELDEPGAEYALMLSGMATGSDMRAVLDEDAIRAAQGKAFYTDDPRTQLTNVFLSILFLSPPGSPPNGNFVSIVRNKDVVKTYTCYPSYCNGRYETERPHTRDMAGLIEASVPVEYVSQEFKHHDQARAAHFRALRDPDVVYVEPPNLPSPSTIVYPNRVVLSLPAVLLEMDEATNEPLTPFDEAEYMARFTAAFEHAFPDTEAYRLGDLRYTTYYPPNPNGWSVVSDELEGRYLRTTEGYHRGLQGIMVIEPYLNVELIPDMAATLMEPEPFASMPDFAREPDSLAPRLAALAEEVLGRPCPECFQIELPVATVDKILVAERKPIPYTLTYYKVAPDEPPAQQ